MKSKVCPRCGQPKSKDSSWCRKCYLKGVKEHRTSSNYFYYETHREQILAARKEKRKEKVKELREQILTHYGGGICACVRCGFSDIRALDLDHIDGLVKGEKRKSGRRLINLLFFNGLPEGYQTLCRNCNWIKFMESKE